MVEKKRSIRLDWEDLRVLVELAHHGSLSATARALGVTHATISRRISSLEDDLSQPLFVKESGRYVLTAGGKRVLDLASSMADSAQAILRAASGQGESLQGPVRITCTESVGIYIVLPALKVIRERYPDVEINLNITQLNLSLARSDADIAVRLAKPPANADLFGVKVANLDYRLYAAKSYLDQHAPGDFTFIGYPTDLAEWPEARTLDTLTEGRRLAIRTSNLGNRIFATRQGLGVALLPSIMAKAWPDLVETGNGEAVMSREVYVIVHQDLKNVPRIKASFEALIEQIASRTDT